MTNIKDFGALTQLLAKKGTRKRIVVVSPEDESTRWALERARHAGFCDTIIVDDEDKALASQKAVDLIREKKGDVLMKGFVNTDVLLHAILNKERGILEPGSVMTHITVASIPGYDKLLFFTDAAVIPIPTQEQRIQQVKYMVDICHKFGIEVPRISLIHSSEKVDTRHFPYTEGYLEIKEMAKNGAFGKCIIDGPLDLKTSCDQHAMQVKGIKSPLNGHADALIFPNIQTGNVFYKTITLFCNATTAGILQGTHVPVVVPSRGDSPETKFNSIAVACAL
ncbi:MAG: phosphate acyltransferase [Prevotella sp.]|jgi:phosphate butyryltransferase